jgi:DNA-binding transcriptional MocR family regulator
MVVGTFMKRGGLAAHIETLRATYRTRRDAMYAALAREMPEGVTWTRTEGGFFLWLTLPPRTDVAKMNARGVEERIVTLSGTECFPDGRGTHNLRLAFSLQPPDRIAEGIRRLGRAVRAGL